MKTSWFKAMIVGGTMLAAMLPGRVVADGIDVPTNETFTVGVPSGGKYIVDRYVLSGKISYAEENKRKLYSKDDCPNGTHNYNGKYANIKLVLTDGTDINC